MRTFCTTPLRPALAGLMLLLSLTPVMAAEIPTYITMGDFSVQAGRSLTLGATLYDKATNSGLPGKTLAFAIDGVGVSGPIQTDSTGKARFTVVVPQNYPLGPHSVSVAFAGDSVYGPSSRVRTLTVKAIPLRTTRIVMGDFFGWDGDFLTLKATLLGVAPNTVLPGKVLQFAIDGVNVGGAVLTNAAGTAKYKFIVPQDFPLGAHSVTVTFAGDGAYSGSSQVSNLDVSAGAVKIEVGDTYGWPGGFTYTEARITTMAGVPVDGGTIYFNIYASGVNPDFEESTVAGGYAIMYFYIGRVAEAGVYVIAVDYDGTDTLLGGSAGGRLYIEGNP